MDRIYVVGAGGIGCAVGYALLAGGGRATFVEVDPAKVAWGKQHGVRVDQRPPFPAEFVSFADWQPTAGSTILLCTKCYDNAAVLARLPADLTLIPIQNGFDPALDARGHAWEGIASFVSECLPGQTHTRITRSGKLHLGLRRAGAEVASGLADVLQKNDLFRVEWVADILPYKYTKLMYNAAISPLAAAAGLDNGQLLSVPVARRLFFQMLRENYVILHGAGIPLAKIGPFHPDTVQWILRHRFAARSLAWAFYPTLRGTYCSMSGDLPKGITEIDNYNGHLIAVAGNRPCPLNRRLYELVKKMERERSAPTLQVLDELLEAPLNAIA
jgi:2-dehydropantoate 2-reductase